MAIQSNDSLSRETRAQEIHQIVSSSFDFNDMARDILGPTYNLLGSGQRSEFIDTFKCPFRIPIPGWFSTF
jgi:ABC-type transporter MlaC component